MWVSYVTFMSQKQGDSKVQGELSCPGSLYTGGCPRLRYLPEFRLLVFQFPFLSSRTLKVPVAASDASHKELKGQRDSCLDRLQAKNVLIWENSLKKKKRDCLGTSFLRILEEAIQTPETKGGTAVTVWPGDRVPENKGH